jgi:hypothetical protein
MLTRPIQKHLSLIDVPYAIKRVTRKPRVQGETNRRIVPQGVLGVELEGGHLVLEGR